MRDPKLTVLLETPEQYALTSGFNVTLRNRYDGHGNLLSKDNGPTQQYDPKRLHQLTQVDGVRYQYDEAGNQISGGGRDIKWTSYNQPFEIKKTDGSSRLRLAYNADRLRMVKEDKTQGKITWYSGGGRYERIRERDGSEVHKYHLSIGGQAVMYLSQYISAGNTLRAAHTRYLLNDHLGSPMVVTDTYNHALQHLSFNAWGQRRYATWRDFLLRDPKLTVLLEALDQYALTRGFTGHEHDDEVGLIHMKGRLYDPQLGRFISADPFVQAPTNTQSYNRYSYVMNNPLSYTDPSGYFFSKLLGGIGSFVRRWGRTIVAVAVGILIPAAIIGPAGFAAVGPAKAILAGAAGGFAGGLISTGSLRGALQGAALGGLSAGLAHGIAYGIPGTSFNGIEQGIGRSIAHGVAQGTVSHLQGGKFRSGFIGGFVGHEARVGSRLLFGDGRAPSLIAARTAFAAVAGGTVSKIVGGKFANGAVTAAFVHLFNAEVGALGGTAPRPIDWGEIGGRIWSGVRVLGSRLLGALSFAAPTTMGNAALDPDSVYFHYTDGQALNSIVASGVIRADARGRVFVTQDSLSPMQAQNLFAGNPDYVGRGSHFISFTVNEGVTFEPGTMPNELIHRGSMRFGRQIKDVIYAGENFYQ